MNELCDFLLQVTVPFFTAVPEQVQGMSGLWPLLDFWAIKRHLRSLFQKFYCTSKQSVSHWQVLILPPGWNYRTAAKCLSHFCVLMGSEVASWGQPWKLSELSMVLWLVKSELSSLQKLLLHWLQSWHKNIQRNRWPSHGFMPIDIEKDMNE